MTSEEACREEKMSKRQLQDIISPNWKKMLLKKEHHKIAVCDRELISDLEMQRDNFMRIYNHIIKNVYLNKEKEISKHVGMLNHFVTELEERFINLKQFQSLNEYVLKVKKCKPQ